MNDSIIWAIAEVTESTPDNLEYGNYRGFVLLRDDVAERQIDSVEEGVAAYAAHAGVDVGCVTLKTFLHDQYQWYRTLGISES